MIGILECIAMEPANIPPERLSVDDRSPYYDKDALERGVGVRFNGRDRDDVMEYSVSEQWIRVAVGKTVDRAGRQLTIKLKGTVEPYFRT